MGGTCPQTAIHVKPPPIFLYIHGKNSPTVFDPQNVCFLPQNWGDSIF